MLQFGVVLEMEVVRDARLAWKRARAEFDQQCGDIMDRLILEAAANRMSVEQVEAASGYNKKWIRARMRALGVNPRGGRNLIAKAASEALQENARLLQVDPKEIDLMSPLAYLPMGEALRSQLEQVSGNEGEQ